MPNEYTQIILIGLALYKIKAIQGKKIIFRQKASLFCDQETSEFSSNHSSEEQAKYDAAIDYLDSHNSWLDELINLIDALKNYVNQTQLTEAYSRLHNFTKQAEKNLLLNKKILAPLKRLEIIFTQAIQSEIPQA